VLLLVPTSGSCTQHHWRL